MTRLYDPMGSFTCSVCNKHPNIGWLYLCTQDPKGFLPECEFKSQDTSSKTTVVTLDFDADSLSPSILKGVGEGQYTADQVKTLIQQKERVRDVIFGTAGRPPTASTTSTTDSSSSEGTFSILPQSTTFSTISSASLDEEIKAAYDWKELQKAWMSEPSMPPPECKPRSPLTSTPGFSESLTLPADQICNFKVCPTCRPTYRERACQSLDHILNNPVKLPPMWEFENRKVADARIVARLPTASRFYAQNVPSSFESQSSALEMAIGHAKGSTSSHQVDETHSVRKRSGFRHTVRKALTRARLEDPPLPPNLGDNDPAQNSNPDPSQPSRSLIFKRRRSRSTLSFVETHGRIVDTSALQDSVMLMVATNTPLPHTPTVSSHQLSRMAEQSTEQDNHATPIQDAGIVTQA